MNFQSVKANAQGNVSEGFFNETPIPRLRLLKLRVSGPKGSKQEKMQDSITTRSASSEVAMFKTAADQWAENTGELS